MEVVGAISWLLLREYAEHPPSPPPLFSADEASVLSRWLPPQGGVLYHDTARGVLLLVIVISFHGQHVLAAARGARRAAATIMRQCGRRALRVATPHLRERFLTELLPGEFYSPLLAPVSLVAISLPLRGSLPNARHRHHHNLVLMQPPGSAGGPPPQGQVFLAAQILCPCPWRPSSWAPSPHRRAGSPASHHRHCRAQAAALTVIINWWRWSRRDQWGALPPSGSTHPRAAARGARSPRHNCCRFLRRG